MCLEKNIETLVNSAGLSGMESKHASIATINGCRISPAFYNYMRTFMLGVKCGSAHAEFALINYLVNSFWCSINNGSCKKSCIL